MALNTSSLRPALKAMILALLPCLEEEATEEFDRTLQILSVLKEVIGGERESTTFQTDASGDQYFWQCIFLASITSRSRRPGALAYLTRKMPVLGQPLSTKSLGPETNGHHYSTDESNGLDFAVNAVASPEPGLLIRCFCAGLCDQQLLTQRGFLDLLVTNLPLHSPILQGKVVLEDLEKLISAATSVVARRDMSLNRRLWSWFLGPELVPENSNVSTNTPGQEAFAYQSHYFEQYGLEPLIRTILNTIASNAESPVERARPLRICLSLMDRWEIGGLVVPRMFLPAIRSVWQYQNIAVPRESTAEVLRSANMFFDGVESGIIWSAIVKVIIRALDQESKSSRTSCDDLNLIFFIVTTFNIREEEMLVVHMPLVTLVLLLRITVLSRRVYSQGSPGRSDDVLLALKITNRLLDLIPSRAFDSEDISQPENGLQNIEEVHLQDSAMLSKAERFYARNQGNLDIEGQPLTPQEVGRAVLRASLQTVTLMLQSNSLASYSETDAAVTILNIIIRKVPKLEKPSLEEFSTTLLGSSLELASEKQTPLPFPLIAGKISALETVCGTPSQSWLSDRLVRRLIPSLVISLWASLSPSRPKYNVEAVRCLWRLQTVSTDEKLIESTISTLLRSHEIYDETTPIDRGDARRFATLWTHSPSTSATAPSRRSSLVRSINDSSPDTSSAGDLVLLERPLMLMLDVLDTPKSTTFDFVVGWLQSLPSLKLIIGMLIDRVTTLPSTEVNRSATPPSYAIDESDDPDLYNYYLQLLLRVIEHSPSNAWPAIAMMSNSKANDDTVLSTNAVLLSRLCLSLLQRHFDSDSDSGGANLQLKQTALLLLQQFLEGPTSASIAELEIEDTLLEELVLSVELGQSSLQNSLMKIIIVAMRVRLANQEYVGSVERQHPVSRDHMRVPSGLSISTNGDDRKTPNAINTTLSPKLLRCLILGLTARNSRPVLDGWIVFLSACLPLYGDSIFQILIPLVECFCNTLGAAFKNVQSNFGNTQSEDTETFEPTLALLLNGLEQSLATAHDRLMSDDVGSTPVKSPEPQQQSFFGTMVSGVFATETNRAKSATANNRLTVLLCFKDAVRVCFTIWLWGDYGAHSPLQDSAASASFNYTILRLRNRTRRIFEHLFAAEALECLETLIELWLGLVKEESTVRSATVFNLLHVLEASRPKNAIPAMFNAIYSRTNPSALDPIRKSTLTSNLSDTSLAAFLVAYTKSLEDDAMDEIWNDCMTFLKDVLANPMPHRQTLPRLLEFTAVLGEKVDNTTFGEQRKMRRELGDLFVRLLTATLTIRPVGFSLESPYPTTYEKLSADGLSTRRSFDNRGSTGSESLINVLATITPNFSKVLVDSDRIASTTLTISTQIIGPTFRSRSFPENISQRTLDLMIALSSIAEATRAWKKDVAEAFNDLKFFSTTLSLAQHGWVPIIRQWSLADKERMPELLSRLTTPTSAGIMFGVGANSARLEADRKAQLNLRRIALLILTAANDTFVVNLNALQEKIVDLLNATAASSPSSTTRAEIYMVIRALLLKTSAHHLASMWPTINSELYDAISSVFPNQSADQYNVTCLLQACKLLDVLLTLELDDFQMQEWLFITDTTDAVYRSSDSKSVAMVDELADELDSRAEASHFTNTSLSGAPQEEKRWPLLTSNATKGIGRDDLMEKVLRPFFRQLSIYAFESTYSMAVPDWKVCFDDLMADLFDDNTLV